MKQWRGSPEAAARIEREFPALAGALARPESRRQVLRLMAASMALGGLAGCDDPSQPDGHYFPAVNPAADIVPGLPNHYATALEDGGAGAGIVVTQQMGRPIKVEGNPGHPASLGATSIHGQAVLLDFYDIDRQSGVLHAGDVATDQALQLAMLAERSRLAETQGSGFRILTGRMLSPSLQTALTALVQRYPRAQWHRWEPVLRDAVWRGTELAYGRQLDVLPRVEKADVILALESDLIGGAPGHLRHARDFAGRRNPVRARMSRVYAAEAVPTTIGGSADHRIVAGPREMHAALTALASMLLESGSAADAPRWVAACAADLHAAGPRALIHAGPELSAEAHALVHRLNERLGARGTTFDLIEPAVWQPGDEAASMAALLAAMQAGRVETLLILGSNPVYAQPGFAAALRRVRFSLSTAPSPDETARVATWHVPQTHLFEAWGDIRAHDGTVTIQQPQALPLFGGRAAVETLALFTGEPAAGVRQTWRPALDDAAWQDALANGVVPNTAYVPVEDKPQAATPMLSTPVASELNLLLRPDPNLLDGRYANNPWLQELPRPIGKLVWDNPLLIAPALAQRMTLEDGDEVEIGLGGRTLRASVWMVPGLAEDCTVLWLGGGRTSAGEVGNGVGVNAAELRGAEGTPSLRKTGARRRIASTDHHNVLEVDHETIDHIVHHGKLADFQADPEFLHKSGAEPSIYHRPRGPGVAWGMSVDLNACIGCNACVVACQAENNVPVVGRDQVLIGREMHWLRIDRYYEGEAANPDALLQPMLCMHCEDAPCEPVCPVEASIHDSEGLNLQVYNRCIGTRFCSNNCPYKVRRFNFGAWTANEHRPEISRNPDVTVRSRGVMEKCTFCVQRIAEARIAHDRDGTPEQVVTACQAACPTQAFTFGDINDPQSEVTARKHSPLDYALLPEQNTHPRLSYEARIRNPHPDLPA